MAGGGPKNTTTTYSPPSWAQPSYVDYLNKLWGTIYPGSSVDPKTGAVTGSGNLAPSPYPPTVIAPFSPSQTEAMSYVSGLGPQSPLADAAQQQQIDTISGKYLGPNPYLNDYYNEAARNLTSQYETSTAPDITAQAVAQGALGSSGHAQTQETAREGLATGLGTLGANIYEPAYQYERGLQQAAVNQAPGTIGAQYIAPQMELGVGGQQQGQLQNILNAATDYIQRTNLWPYTGLSQLAQGLGVVSGGNQVITAPNLSQGLK